MLTWGDVSWRLNVQRPLVVLSFVLRQRELGAGLGQKRQRVIQVCVSHLVWETCRTISIAQLVVPPEGQSGTNICPASNWGLHKKKKDNPKTESWGVGRPLGQGPREPGSGTRRGCRVPSVAVATRSRAAILAPFPLSPYLCTIQLNEYILNK